MKKLLTPRGYLSWTQVDMWRRSKDRYIRRYFEGGEDFSNEAMRFGKRTSEALEGAEDDDELMTAVVALLPRYEKREHQIRVPFKTKNGTVDLLGRMDTFGMKQGPRFREYKTGVTVWTQAKAEKHPQMKHYGALIWLEKLTLPTEAWLDWAQTAWETNAEGFREIRFTGQISTFHVKISVQDILEYLAIVSKVAQEIDKEYNAYLKSLV